jgi:ATP-binding cassette subfamily B protein
MEDIHLQIEPGQRVVIAGPSGAGKTTLLSLMLRLYDPIRGRIRIDGHDIREFTLESLRSQIGVVLQDNVLFAAAVCDNIAYGCPGVTLQEVESAARLANAHEFISALPNGYETVLGEKGVTLSHGQRQRIAIARAAIRQAPILILDEPTSGLDKQNEKVVLEALARLNSQRTTFLVTHDLAHAVDADLVLFVQAGRIVERGKHSELVQANGCYAAMYRVQSSRATSRTDTQPFELAR